MKKALKSIILTRQELLIMKVVWNLGSATVKEVCATICQVKPTAYTTILTLMGILEEKGALVHERVGRAFVYKPLLSKRQATKNHLGDIMTRFFEGDLEKMLAYVLENEIKNIDQVNDIRTMLLRWEGRILAPEEEMWQAFSQFGDRSDS
ncbi:MAG: BlaI/MecI/CopY family transcriptional regulator [Acidobacteriota bacterium]|jgi:predicted transcriptional regulator|nr:BlaI/MecI/CopY family transcriptional regulator [Acidobacteriota bacterium]